MKTHKTVPILLDEQLAGLVFANNVPQAGSEPEQTLLSQFADYAATTMRTTQRYQEQEYRIARYRALVSLQQELALSLDIYHVAQTLVKAITTLLDVPFVTVWCADETTRMLRAEASSDRQIGRDLVPSSVRFGEGSVGHVAVSRQSLDIPDVFAVTSGEPMTWWHTYHFSSLYALPVLFDHTLYAVLALYGYQPFQHDAETQEFLDQLGHQAAIALYNATLHTSALTTLQQVAQIVMTCPAPTEPSSACQMPLLPGHRKQDEISPQPQGTSPRSHNTQRLNLIRQLLMNGSATPPS